MPCLAVWQLACLSPSHEHGAWPFLTAWCWTQVPCLAGSTAGRSKHKLWKKHIGWPGELWQTHGSWEQRYRGRKYGDRSVQLVQDVSPIPFASGRQYLQQTWLRWKPGIRILSWTISQLPFSPSPWFYNVHLRVMSQPQVVLWMKQSAVWAGLFLQCPIHLTHWK